MDYRKLWRTLKAESGHRETESDWLPDSQNKLTVKELMDNMEQREIQFSKSRQRLKEGY